MTEFFEFLNQQSGDRLFFFGVMFILTLYFIFQIIIYVFGDAFNRRKTESKDCDNCKEKRTKKKLKEN